MDIKWLFYLVLSFLWTRLYGIPQKQLIYDGSLFFSKLYIGTTLILKFLTGAQRIGILSEANYDCYLFLIGFCFITTVKYKTIDWLIFFIATLLSGSQTGLLSFFAICIVICWKYSRKNVILLFIVGIISSYFLFINRRGVVDITTIDRFIFFAQAYDFFKENSLMTILFGWIPGEEMEMNILPTFEFYIDFFEDKNALSGVYPFYFHASYIRYAITWGIPLVAIVLMMFIRKFIKTDNMALRNLIVLVLLQSVSLSALSLTTVSVAFFIAYYTSLQYSHPFKTELI